MQLIQALLLMLVASITEFFTLALVMPFLLLITNPDFAVNNRLVGYFIDIYEISNFKVLQIFFALMFAACAILASLIKIINLRNYIHVAQSIGTDLSTKAFNNILYQNYSYHVNTNSSESIAAISNHTNITVNFIINLLQICTSFFTSSGILIALIIINPKLTIYTMIFVTTIYLTISIYTS